uniref:Uncharacterized protein n=1 Tax=Cacopsylla melanoneura TaxID=428564 RepID=A0A8D8ZDF3_9HEMI
MTHTPFIDTSNIRNRSSTPIDHEHRFPGMYRLSSTPCLDSENRLRIFRVNRHEWGNERVDFFVAFSTCFFSKPWVLPLNSVSCLNFFCFSSSIISFFCFLIISTNNKFVFLTYFPRSR